MQKASVKEKTLWQNHLEFLQKRFGGILSGAVIGVPNAIYSIYLFKSGHAEGLTNGLEAVFSRETQRYFAFSALLLLILIPVFPVLVKVLINIYDGILFGISFLTVNIIIFLIVSPFVDESPLTSFQVFAFLAMFAMLWGLLALFGPLIFDRDIESIAVAKDRRKKFYSPKVWWVWYVVYAELMLLVILFLLPKL